MLILRKKKKFFPVFVNVVQCAFEYNKIVQTIMYPIMHTQYIIQLFNDIVLFCSESKYNEKYY